MTENLREVPYYTYSSLVDSSLMGESNNILDLIIDAPTLRTKTLRNYLKVQELFARVGGLANAFMITVKILTYHFMKFKFYFFVHENSFAVAQGSSSKQSSCKNENVLCHIQQNNISKIMEVSNNNKRKEEDLIQEEIEVNFSNENLVKEQSHKESNLVACNSKKQIKSFCNISVNNFVSDKAVNSKKASRSVMSKEEKKKHMSPRPMFSKKQSKKGKVGSSQKSKLPKVNLESKESIQELSSSQISYWNYLRSSTCPCLPNDLTRKYDY
eukprot:CAMPEP_0170531486 /NCGR_PEP_ID=MMETSP0209-20121228/62279_1 /TAXON_ID=665100 ORGANISM="Litonotus pictus, Strain P1" /NCGR_SAMPLE_ID=MMETSP0209 /ASSEMBLY_ACC=CAM_ASM_000301 /LENGTH=269 /DNA_ID=CAMNT_0010826179 /DNA_START=114 /DNA_END=920 /DNA_ORIENTATION=-